MSAGLNVAEQMALRNAVEFGGPFRFQPQDQPYSWRPWSMEALEGRGMAEFVCLMHGRKAYRITDAGRAAYRALLNAPPLADAAE